MLADPSRRYIALAAVAALIGAVVVVAGLLGREVRTETAETAAQELARPLATLCREDEPRARAAGADCSFAETVARDGVDGRDGENGRGIVGTQLDERGHLIVAYTDGTAADVGPVLGAPGAPGEPGRGITSTLLDDGRLVVVFDDGERVDLGRVVGPAGVGIAGLDGSTGRLLVTLTDGEVLDAGPLPEGRQGERGERGEPAPVVASVTRTYADGSAERCERTGGTDVDPVFTCEREPAPAEPGPEPTPPPTSAGPLIGG